MAKKNGGSPAKAATTPKPLTATQAYNKAYSTAGKTAGKKVAQTAGKTVAKTIAKRLPYVGGAIAIGDLAYQAYDAYKENKKANAPKGTGDIMSTMEKNKGKSFSASGKPSTSKSSIKDVPEGLKKLVDDKNYSGRIKTRSNDLNPIGKASWNPEYLGPSGKDYAEDALLEKGSAPKQGPIKKAGSSSSAPKPTGGGSGTSGSKRGGGAKRKPVRTASVAVAGPKREMPSSTISKPSTSGIQKGPEKRKFSDKEIKMMEIMQKGKKKNGTLKASAQRKIQKIRKSK